MCIHENLPQLECVVLLSRSVIPEIESFIHKNLAQLECGRFLVDLL